MRLQSHLKNLLEETNPLFNNDKFNLKKQFLGGAAKVAHDVVKEVSEPVEFDKWLVRHGGEEDEEV